MARFLIESGFFFEVMKTYEMIKGLQQHYDKYTAEDQKVWKILFERQMNQLPGMADDVFIAAVEEIGFTNRIPDFNDVNKRLADTTGWTIYVVPGIIKEIDFFQLLANKQFPSSTWLRSIESLDYLSEPDMFHDAFGHMPLLTNPTFSSFFQHIGKLGVRYHHVPEILVFLGRIYWFTVEFGLIQREGKDVQIYGAGILSSAGESKFSLSDQPKRLSYDIEKVINTDFDNTVIQEHYFVINSFEEIDRSLKNIEPMLAEIAKKQAIH